MYWSASIWIWPSMSSSLSEAGMVMILVMTADPGTASAASLARVFDFCTAFWMASPTASTSWMTFSATASVGSGSTA
jgi:hypothetical protein